jgi:site-specific DNA recombinase
MTTTAREYLRVSDDKSGTARSTTEQHVENQEAADERDWQLGQPYIDNDRSASRFARAAREDFDALVGDLEADRFGAEILILWEGSRGSREIEEWVRLVKLCERRGVRFYITSDDRLLDPANDSDWDQLINMGRQQEAESRKTSKRVKRATKASALAGRPHGRTPYGYRRVYAGAPPKLVGQEADPDESPVIAELFERLQAGHSLRGIAVDYEARGIRRRDGGVFSQQHLRNLARRHCYMGQRIYVAGRDTDKARPAELVEAIWPAIVEPSTWHAVQRILDDPKRVTRKPGKAKHLLSLIATCGVCGAGLTVLLPGGEGKNVRKQSVYRCGGKGCVKVPQAELDAEAAWLICQYLADPNVYQVLPKAADTDELQVQRVRNELAKVRAELDELAAALVAGQISATLAGKAETGMLARKEELAGQLDRLLAPVGLAIEPGPDVEARWQAADPETKREVARVVLSADYLGVLAVGKSPRRGAPVLDRIELLKPTA